MKRSNKNNRFIGVILMNEQLDVIKFLEGERVYLRPIEEQDLGLFYTKALWDKEGRKLTGTQTVFSRQGVQSWFERISTDSSRIDQIICLQENNQPIGDVSMMDIDHQNRSAVVRISIFKREYWGNGFGTVAMSLLLNFGFGIINLHRVGLDVFSYNIRGIKAYEKLGFKQEGTIRDALYYDGEYHDSILMGVLKSEFVRSEE
jgi:RimJ/RimL family protein N-acetyltransferase